MPFLAHVRIHGGSFLLEIGRARPAFFRSVQLRSGHEFIDIKLSLLPFALLLVHKFVGRLHVEIIDALLSLKLYHLLLADD